MTRALRFCCMLLLATLVSAAYAPSKGAPQTAAAPAQEATTVHDQYVAAFNRRDADTLAALFASDAVFVDGAGMPTQGRSRIKAMFEQGFRDLDMTIEAIALQVDALGDGAWEIGRGAQVFKEGERVKKLPFHYTVVFVREDGALRVRAVNLAMDQIPPPK